jgi:phospholipase C
MVAVAMLATAPSPEHRPVALAAEQPAPEIDPALGIFNLDHVIFVVQENRSFDHYFGTFPGADGIPQHVCLPDPKRHRCARPYHDTNIFDAGGPHNERASRITTGRWTERSVRSE